jgi:hypothetical protein
VCVQEHATNLCDPFAAARRNCCARNIFAVKARTFSVTAGGVTIDTAYSDGLGRSESAFTHATPAISGVLGLTGVTFCAIVV